jgi:hypothetical protein
MRIDAALKAACVLVMGCALTGALAATKNEVDAAMGRDGLQKIKVKGLELAYARPGATLAAYKRVQLDPVEVEFHKSWDPARTGSRIKLSSEEREKIRTSVARIVQEEFVRALQKDGKYQIVSEAGPDVLRVKPSIVGLYVNAPDAGGAGRSRTYVASAGEMTLIAELADSTSGQALARVADRREANGGPRMQLASSMVNEDEARTIASAWARILRNALDKAQTIGAK